MFRFRDLPAAGIKTFVAIASAERADARLHIAGDVTGKLWELHMVLGSQTRFSEY